MTRKMDFHKWQMKLIVITLLVFICVAEVNGDVVFALNITLVSAFTAVLVLIGVGTADSVFTVALGAVLTAFAYAAVAVAASAGACMLAGFAVLVVLLAGVFTAVSIDECAKAYNLTKWYVFLFVAVEFIVVIKLMSWYISTHQEQIKSVIAH